MADKNGNEMEVKKLKTKAAKRRATPGMQKARAIMKLSRSAEGIR